jgi:ABC-type glycerol-3-phosphate transport system permease component
MVMESLAIVVSIILGLMFLSTFSALGFSFVKKKWGKILTIIFSIIGGFFGITLIVTADGNNNAYIMGGIIILLVMSASINSLMRNRRKNK